ncbi:hypothetical protein EUX98_g3474 [Antrodiella citrinella]|uniref:RanBP2-type domain-containing protein n=1 Tax=Antrodiella citrinella TaxID=2447956 RepID=A0A4V3XIV9_9APHY|nr:hypothetical protein EUX98_g3474 [Antrodiella citrinella]
MKLTAQMPTTDKKRRRVGQDAESSGPQRTPAASSSSNANGQSQASASGTFVNGATSPPPSRTKAPVQPSTPRIRTNNLPAKPTAPTNPSPLRQAWNHNDSPSPPQPPASKPTRAANLMSELLKMDVPVPTPDFSNPYEAAGPVPAKPATRRPVTKRPRVVAANHAEMKKEEKKEEKKVAEMSPQKIIEATVPKGSKRSRPPPDLDSSGPKTDPREPPAPRRSSRLKSPEPRVTNGINGIAGASNGARVPPPVVEEDESPTKKQKTSTASGLMNNKKMTVTIEEVEDVDMPAPPSTYTRPSEIIEPVDSPQRQRSQSPTAATSPTSPVRNPYGMKSSAPKAPSKLRYSIKADADSDKGEDDEKEKNMPSFVSFPPLPLPRNRAAASSSTSTSSAPARPIAPTRSKSISKSEAETKDSVLTLAVEDLPKFTFAAPAFSPVAGPGPSTQKSRELAIAAAKAALPAFDFSTRSMSFGTTWGKSAAAPQSTVSIAKPPGTSVGEQWTCSTCMLKNPASATEKCTVCDESRPKPASAPATGGFNWAAAGMKKPEAAEAKWTCSVCMLSNPPSATQCTVCEADR